jgi:hypothetical protein
VRLAEAEGEREENRGTRIVLFASAMSRRVIVITIRTLNFTCAEEVCEEQELKPKKKLDQIIISDNKKRKNDKTE